MALNLPTMAQVAAERAFKPIPKGQSRLQKQVAEKKLAVVDEKAFKAAVWARDGSRCRCCQRKVTKTMSRVPERGEVHHCNGRRGDLRFDDRCALLLCGQCHEKVTGRVAEKVVIVPTRTIVLMSVKGRPECVDARFPVKFERVA